jgi:hypothetical protein
VLANVGDGAVLTGYFDQLSRKQQSPMLAASAYDPQDSLGGDQVLNGGLAHPNDLCEVRLAEIKALRQTLARCRRSPRSHDAGDARGDPDALAIQVELLSL